ncbi:MAG: hypothetical protein ACLTWC_00310 [Bifidobacterium breve]
MGMTQVRIAQQHYDQLAIDMISFLREHGYKDDADYGQMLFDEDGDWIPVQTGIEVIMENHLDPTPFMPLAAALNEEDEVFREEHQEFSEYIRRWQSEHAEH